MFKKWLSGCASAIIVISNSNQVIWNVLGESSENPIKIVSLPSSVENNNQTVQLLKTDNITTLEVDTGSVKKSVDVTGFGDNIIEIEQSQDAKRISISQSEDKFLITQQDVVAQTGFPIKINPDGRYVIVVTPSGERYLGIFPSDAIDSILKTQIIDKVSVESGLSLTEGEAGVLEYVVNGEKNIKLFNLFEISAPVTLKISAIDGIVLGKDSPVWYKVLGFLFENGGV